MDRKQTVMTKPSSKMDVKSEEKKEEVKQQTIP
jgi:hypothetical protein